MADASAIGSLLIPWQKRLGYPPAFSAATLAAAATIDILIPPSIPMILFALVREHLDRARCSSPASCRAC